MHKLYLYQIKGVDPGKVRANEMAKQMTENNGGEVIVSRFGSTKYWWVATYDTLEEAIEAYKNDSGKIRIRSKATRKILWEK